MGLIINKELTQMVHYYRVFLSLTQKINLKYRVEQLKFIVDDIVLLIIKISSKTFFCTWNLFFWWLLNWIHNKIWKLIEKYFHHWIFFFLEMFIVILPHTPYITFILFLILLRERERENYQKISESSWWCVLLIKYNTRFYVYQQEFFCVPQ